MTARGNLYRRAVPVIVQSGFQSFFVKSYKINQILLGENGAKSNRGEM